MKKRIIGWALSISLVFSPLVVPINATQPINSINNKEALLLHANSSAYMDSEGYLYLWGSGQNIKKPTFLSTGITSFVTSSWDGDRAIITEDGELYMWGSSWGGILGNGVDSYENVSISDRVKVMDNVAMVSVGEYHCGAVTTEGDLYVWGYNKFGQVGNGTTNNQLVPQKIMSNVKKFFAGHSCSGALTTNGDLYMWGYNQSGELGVGSTENKATPTLVLSNVTSVCISNTPSGENCSFAGALTENGELYMWGHNIYGQLGIPSDGDVLSPVKILEKVKSFQLSYHHAGAITYNNDLYMWGYNSQGQVGNDSQENQKEPIRVLSNIADFSMGYAHTGAITKDGDVYTWGNNYTGSTGNGKNEGSQLAPQKILSDCKAINFGYSHSGAITQDGSVLMWGTNSNYQLGIGTTEYKTRPTKIVLMSAKTLFQDFPQYINEDSQNYGLLSDTYNLAHTVITEKSSGWGHAISAWISVSDFKNALKVYLKGAEIMGDEFGEAAAQHLFLTVAQTANITSTNKKLKEVLDNGDNINTLASTISLIVEDLSSDEVQAVIDSTTDHKEKIVSALDKNSNDVWKNVSETVKIQKYVLQLVALYESDIVIIDSLIKRLEDSSARNSDLLRHLYSLRNAMTGDPVKYIGDKYILHEKAVDVIAGTITKGIEAKLPPLKIANSCLKLVSIMYEDVLKLPTVEDKTKAIYLGAYYDNLGSALAYLRISILTQASAGIVTSKTIEDYEIVYNAFITSLIQFAESAEAMATGQEKDSITERIQRLKEYCTYDQFIRRCMSAAEDEARSQFLYEKRNGGITINGYATGGGSRKARIEEGSEERREMLAIPSEIDGLPVVAVAEGAFKDSNEIATLYIPDSVSSIGKSAFQGCSSLELILWSDNITEVGEWAFDNCRMLSSVSLPSGINTINASSFSNCYSLQHVDIPCNIVSIADSAFQNDTNLAIVKVNSTNEINIAPNAFSGVPVQSLTVSGANDTVAQNVAHTIGAMYTEVSVPAVDLSIVSLPDKKDYIQGEELLVDGLQVVAKYRDGSSEDVTNQIGLDYDLSEAGSQKVQIAYAGQEASFFVNVKDKTEEQPLPTPNPNPTPTPTPAPTPIPAPTPTPTPTPSHSQPSGGGGGSSAPSYAIEAPTAEHGKVSVSPKRAERREKVTVTVTPDEGYELDTLTVTDGKNKKVELTDLEEGKYTFVMPSSKVKVTATFQKKEEPPVTPPPAETPVPVPSSVPVTDRFTDIRTGDWYVDAVQYVYDKEMMNGVTEDTFSPNTPTSRGMLVTILYRLEEEPSVSVAPFSDVAREKYYASAVAWASQNDLVNGFENGTFRPDNSITREQLAVILYRYAAHNGWDVTDRADLSNYTDTALISTYAKEALSWAKAVGVITGTDWGGIHPGGNTTRAETAAILMRFCENVMP